MAMNTKKTDIILSENTDNNNNNKKFHTKVVLKNFEIPPMSITKLVIREWAFETLPKMELTFEDAGTYMDKYPIADGDVISIEISTTDQMDPLVGEYQVESHEIINVGDANEGGTIIEVVAVLKNKDIYGLIQNRSFPKKSSAEVITQIMEENGIETDVKIESKDFMTWLQINKTNKEFMDEVLNRAYVKENDLVLSYTETNNITTYTTLNTSIGSDPTFILAFSQEYGVIEAPKEAKKIKYDNKEYDAIYYADYEYYDISPISNKMGGNGARISFFDIETEQLVNMDSVDDNIKLTNNSLKHKDNVGKIYDYETRRYIEQNDGDGNVHGNYLQSMLQNKRKHNDFFSTYMTVITYPNTKLRLMDKIIFTIPCSESDMSDYVHSGEYIVGGMTHDLDGNGFYTTKLFLYSNGINANKSLMEEYQNNLNSKV